MKKEMKKFLEWFELEYPTIKLSKKQMSVLNAFFALNVGEGKTFLVKALLEYDISRGVSRRRKIQMKEVM